MLCLFVHIRGVPFKNHVYAVLGIPYAIQGRVTVVFDPAVVSLGFRIHSGLAIGNISHFLLLQHEHITPILLNLHWLPIRYRVVFKILLITYKALNNFAPSYIRDLLTLYVPYRQLRSSSKNLLVIPHFNLKTYGARSSSVAARTLWNTLEHFAI